MPKFILYQLYVHRSEGPHKHGLARICVFIIISQVYLFKAATGTAAQPANTGLWLPNLTRTAIYIRIRTDASQNADIILQHCKVLRRANIFMQTKTETKNNMRVSYQKHKHNHEE